MLIRWTAADGFQVSGHPLLRPHAEALLRAFPLGSFGAVLDSPRLPPRMTMGLFRGPSISR